MTAPRFILRKLREQVGFSILTGALAAPWRRPSAASIRFLPCYDAEFGQCGLPSAITLRVQEGEWKKTFNVHRHR